MSFTVNISITPEVVKLSIEIYWETVASLAHRKESSIAPVHLLQVEVVRSMAKKKE
jgi:hypothetical protein